jgi:hypothetical protein
MKELKISEATPNDISYIYGYLNVPIKRMGLHGEYEEKACYWTAFKAYASGKEREFIAVIDAAYPDKFSHYHIGYSDCN